MTTKKPKVPSAPRHLSRKSTKWRRSVVAEYVLDDSDLLLLRAAAEAWDRMTQARETIAKEGATHARPILFLRQLGDWVT